MGRGRTTTGMIVASLIATIQLDDMDTYRIDDLMADDYVDGDYSTDASQYLNGESPLTLAGSSADLIGEYKTILQLVTVLSHGKRTSSRVANRCWDLC